MVYQRKDRGLNAGSDVTLTAPGTAASDPRALLRVLARARPVIFKVVYLFKKRKRGHYCGIKQTISRTKYFTNQT